MVKYGPMHGLHGLERQTTREDYSNRGHFDYMGRWKNVELLAYFSEYVEINEAEAFRSPKVKVIKSLFQMVSGNRSFLAR